MVSVLDQQSVLLDYPAADLELARYPVRELKNVFNVQVLPRSIVECIREAPLEKYLRVALVSIDTGSSWFGCQAKNFFRSYSEYVQNSMVSCF